MDDSPNRFFKGRPKLFKGCLKRDRNIHRPKPGQKEIKG